MVYPDNERIEALIQSAALPTFQRIRADRSRVSLRLRPLLTHIEENLFERDLDVNKLKRKCGVRDNSLSTSFHAEVGLPPYGYIEDCRTEIACRLLAETRLKIWQIARALGYSSIHVFSRAFKRLVGCAPTAYRRRPCERPRRSNVISIVTPSPRDTMLELARAAKLTSDDVAEVVERLLELYPDSRPAVARVVGYEALRDVPPLRSSGLRSSGLGSSGLGATALSALGRS